MCGIAGYVLSHGAADPAIVESMCDTLRHRGPDDAGYHVDGACGLGMRRLSIIDLATGHQPISNEDATVWIVFNGEIYNYRDLRRRLIDQGHRFRTESDTETLVHLYEQEGVDGFSRIEGMFAFALWDQPKRELVLVRDRFGKKPLYFAHSAAGLWFGSEIKAIRAAGIPLSVDPQALELYFVFNYIPDPRTAFQEVKKLAPGGWLRYRAGGAVDGGRFWKLPVPAERPAAELERGTATARVRELFDRSVKARLVADVPLGAFLSGGIDSSSVVASMALQSKEPIKTFSIGFEEQEYNELPAARLVAERYRTEHHEVLVRPDAVSLVSRLVRHFDEPFGDSSAIPTYLVSEFAARHVKVALTGDGGDELFCGYETFPAINQSRKYDALPQWARLAISGAAGLLPYRAYGKNYLRMISRGSALERYFESSYAPWFLRARLFQPEWMVDCDSAFLRRAFADCLPGGDILSEAVYFEATAKLAGDMLVKVDRMSMAASLEVRCPMLDRELAEFAMRIPHAWKLDGGRGKRILIDALGDRLPPELLRLPKKGFGIPLAKWFRASLRAFLWDHLTSREFLDRGIVREPFVRYLLDEHDRGRRDNQHWLWMLLMLELWFRELASGPGELAPHREPPGSYRADVRFSSTIAR